MLHAVRVFVAVALTAVFSFAVAQSCTEYRSCATNSAGFSICGEWSPSKIAAVQSDVVALNANDSARQYYLDGMNANGTGSIGWCNKPCSGPQYYLQSGIGERACSNPDACGLTTGAKLTQNFTTGWAKSPTPDAVDWVGQRTSPFKPDSSFPNAPECISKCTAVPGKVVNAYRSQEPGPNGLYRTSLDVEYTIYGTQGQNGYTCTPGTGANPAALDPAAPPLACPGSLGTVNGKIRCIPAPGQALPPPMGSKEPVADGSGNPRAGAVPDSGPESGNGGNSRTPATGIGDNNGGPASAASPASGATPSPNVGGSTGRVASTGDGTEQAACGAPGQPICAVKVDETGVPSASPPSMTPAQQEAAIKKSGDDLIAEINKPRTGTAWSWTFQLPTGCQPLTLSAFSISGGPLVLDVCQFRPQIHDLMSMVWVLATIAGLIGMLSRAVNQGGN